MSEEIKTDNQPAEVSFEAALERLQKAEETITDSETNLADSIKAFEAGIKDYKICSDILKSAKQKIEVIEQELGEQGE